MAWVRRGALGMVAVVAMVGGCRHTSPAFEQERALGPAYPGVIIVPSSCADLAACEAECTELGGAACTRAGDLSFARDGDAAERHWLRGCKAGHGPACERLMQVTGREPKVSDAYAARACIYGVARACGMLGRSRGVRARTLLSGDDLLLEAAAAFEAACGRDDWYACWDAASIYMSTKEQGTRSVESLTRTAHVLSFEACNQGDPHACLFQGDRARKRGRPEDAAALYRRACGLALGNSADPARTIDSSPLCAALRPGQVVQPIRMPDTARWPSRSARVFRFLSGTRFPRPSERVSRFVSRSSAKRLVASFAICISDIGTIESVRIIMPAATPHYTRTLFNAIRTWRYAPPPDGRANCTTVTFTYRQS